MTGLSQEQKQQLAEKLDAREKELYADIRREAAKDEGYRQSAGEVADPGDASLADLITDLNHAEVGRDVAELREIGTALQRMHSGEYGACIDCGAEIGWDRLQVQPAALRCQACQTRYEQTHAESGPGPRL